MQWHYLIVGEEGYPRALALDPNFADAHINMVMVYEKMGLGNMAMRHWKEHLKVDATGEWAEIVKEHSGRHE